MSAFFDQASLAHQAELDRAFASGEMHGRRFADADVLAENAALRVRRAIDDTEIYRDGVAAALLCVFAVVSIVGVWGGIAWLVWLS